MKPLIREKGVIDAKLLKKEGKAGVEALVQRVRETAQAMANSHGFVNQVFKDYYMAYFSNSIFSTSDEQHDSWEKILETSDAIYIVEITEG